MCSTPQLSRPTVLAIVQWLASSPRQLVLLATLSSYWREIIMSARHDRLVWWPMCRSLWSAHERQRYVEHVIHHKESQEHLENDDGSLEHQLLHLYTLCRIHPFQFDKDHDVSHMLEWMDNHLELFAKRSFRLSSYNKHHAVCPAVHEVAVQGLSVGLRW